MYGIFAYIWLIFMVNVGKYTIHGWYGYWMILMIFHAPLESPGVVETARHGYYSTKARHGSQGKVVRMVLWSFFSLPWRWFILKCTWHYEYICIYTWNLFVLYFGGCLSSKTRSFPLKTRIDSVVQRSFSCPSLFSQQMLLRLNPTYT